MGREFGAIFREHDIVGCGVDNELECLWFTLNGEVVGLCVF